MSRTGYKNSQTNVNGLCWCIWLSAPWSYGTCHADQLEYTQPEHWYVTSWDTIRLHNRRSPPHKKYKIHRCWREIKELKEMMMIKRHLLNMHSESSKLVNQCKCKNKMDYIHGGRVGSRNNGQQTIPGGHRQQQRNTLHDRWFLQKIVSVMDTSDSPTAILPTQRLILTSV